MKDPYTVLFNIGGLTVWHRDKGGIDGGCVHFMRAHHGNPEVLKAIERDIRFDFKYQFSETGDPVHSTIGIVVQWFFHASYAHFRQNRRKSVKWMRRNLFEIINFAENPVDSLTDSITGRFGEDQESKEERARKAAACVYGWLLREERPWWKHCAFHLHHWRFSHPKLNPIFNRLGIGVGDGPSIWEAIDW